MKKNGSRWLVKVLFCKKIRAFWLYTFPNWKNLYPPGVYEFLFKSQKLISQNPSLILTKFSSSKIIMQFFWYPLGIRNSYTKIDFKFSQNPLTIPEQNCRSSWHKPFVLYITKVLHFVRGLWFPFWNSTRQAHILPLCLRVISTLSRLHIVLGELHTLGIIALYGQNTSLL